jgi:FkbM family methyltransferase
MGLLHSLSEGYHRWRRRFLPPSISDTEWRHETLVNRLDQIEHVITRRFPETVATPACQRDILGVLRLLAPKCVVGIEKKRVGSSGDGGYVQIDDLKGVSRCLSFGVSDDDSWDLAMAKAGIPVEQFDHSIEQAPSSHPLLRFHKKMVSVEASAATVTLPDLVTEHSKSDDPSLILKCDIEGCEWDVFDQASDAVLSKFAQIICEFHDLSHLATPHFRARAARVFAKLCKEFAPVHLHANNCTGLCNVANIALPDTIEITFANRRRYTFTDSSEVFPTPLDAPNDDRLPDIVLGAFRF